MVIILFMNQFDQIENRIKGIIEKGSELLPWTDQGASLVRLFCESMRRYLLEDTDCLKSSPRELRVYMSPDEARLWKSQSDWQKIMQDAFEDTTVELNCRPNLLPELILMARNSLENGQIVISIDENEINQEKTGAVSISKPMKKATAKTEPQSGMVLINLDKTIPIIKTVLNLGRKSSNDIAINDLRVSRFHAQIRKTRDGYMIFDVGSTGGTYINGERITSHSLKSGDVISLAGYTLVFTDERDPEIDSEREITSDLSSGGKP